MTIEDDTHLTEPSDEALGAKLDELAAAKETFSVVERADLARFELLRDGEMVSFASYETRDDSVVVPHVETLPQHRGQGYADRLMAGLLDIIESDGRRIVALCPFAAAHLRDHPRPAVMAV